MGFYPKTTVEKQNVRRNERVLLGESDEEKQITEYIYEELTKDILRLRKGDDTKIIMLKL